MGEGVAGSGRGLMELLLHYTTGGPQESVSK